ncbi:hypothetical protein VMZ82_001318 [Providencia rettgeri]|uniref:DUF6708 domain-containing protein n=1 Tax=Providencia rettgeri TaxID=587 RepID=UPI001F034EC9|nr:DUF6708 domain-containing protein [Providencia rettgeri]EMC8778497.1 hypothetical protein [Providencia rettgeri]MCG9941768.1 hypothetical protein [Providencia rettgeri]HEM7186824.1 hypothetical protein [Providencia rettgeri]
MKEIKEVLVRFPIDRFLDSDDLGNHLRQGQRIERMDQQDLTSDLSLIKLNSSFLEVTDVHYKNRGFLAFTILFFSILILYFLVNTLFSPFDFDWFPVTIFSLGLLFMLCFLKIECFIYTHYPIRFNRKKQLVHLFRTNGAVQTIPWKDIYFTLRQEKPDGLSPKEWYLCGHILDADKLRVIDTFTVSMCSPYKEEVLRFWEFVRRYMEDKKGVKEVAEISHWFLPINEQKESLGLGFRMLNMRVGRIGAILLFPLHILQAPARWLSFQTSKIPQWTSEVEADCQIEDNDPYQFDCHSVDMRWHWRHLLFWRYAESNAVAKNRWKR